MSKRAPWLALFAWVLGAGALVADNPLVKIPMGDMTCSVAVTPHWKLFEAEQEQVPGAPPPAADTVPTITTVEIARLGNLEKGLVTWSDGDISEVWTATDINVTLVERARQIYDIPKGPFASNHFFPSILDLSPTSLDWISSKNFTGQSRFQGLMELHYQKPVLIPDAVPPRSVHYQAWVDPKTLELLALDDGDALYLLTFSGPPKKPLILPARFQAELQHYLSANARPTHL